MIFDVTNLFSNAQPITVAIQSTDQIDLGATGRVVGGTVNLQRDIGPGREIPIRIQVVEAFNNVTSLTIALQVDSSPAFGAAVTVETQTILLSGLTVGAIANGIYYVPRGVNARYCRLFYTPNGTAPTTGRVTAGIVADHQEAP